MKNPRHARSHRNGFILLPVIMLITVTAVVAFSLNQESALDAGKSVSDLSAAEAEYVAQAGLEHSLWQIDQAGCGPYSDMGAQAFGDHSYSTSVTTNAADTQTMYTVAVSDDAWIKSDTPTQNYGSDAQLRTYFSLSPSSTQRSLYRFDLASAGIPSGAQVTSAVAKFYIIDSNTFAAVSVHRVTADWNEATVHWDNIQSDHDSSSITSIPAGSPVNQYVDVNLTSLVQGWINGAIANQGIMLKTTWLGDLAQFSSKEYGDSNARPVLEITVSNNSPATRATVTATGTLADGINRTISRSEVVLFQSPPGSLQLQPDGVEGKDAEIWDQAPNNNYGSSAETWVSSASNDTTRTLLHFNMGAIPFRARILQATLSLERQSGSGADQPVSAHRIMNSWSEDTVTWERRESGTNWNTAGADFDSKAVATTPVGPANQRYEWNITALVQGWVDASYPNYGVVLVAAIPGMPGERFYTSDESQANRRPSLSLTYACECGIACEPPEGSGNVLMIVSSDTAPDAVDLKKRSIIESWGYSVSLLDDNANTPTFNSEVANNDVVFVSDTVNASPLGNKFDDVTKGVVNEESALNDNLGIAGTSNYGISDSLTITDNSDYITALFPTGAVPIYQAPMQALTVSGTLAPGLRILGNLNGIAGLASLDSGAALVGGGTAAGRRVTLPIGPANTFNWDYVNNNGRLIVQRALQWGIGGTGSAPTTNLLMVVVNPASLTTQESTKKSLLETWGYLVNLIDVHDSQTAFDTAAAANNVAYISEDILSGDLGTKLANATIGVVIEENNLVDEFGMAQSILWDSGTVLEINDNSHYITSPFALGSLTVLSASESLADLDGTLAPDLDKLASNAYGFSVTALDSGATTHTGGSAAGRRVQLPWGGNDFDVNNLNANGLTIFQRALEWGAGAGSSGGCNGTFRDEFSTRSFANNDGTLNWSGDWLEVGESNGADSGDIQIREDSEGHEDHFYKLRTRDNDNGGEGVEREADLSGATSATLSYSYRREELDNSGDYTAVEISANGSAGPWTELVRHQGSADDANYQSANHDISAYVSSNTRIRFVTSSSMGGNDIVWFDNVQIQCSP